jgi:hypothetical protein
MGYALAGVPREVSVFAAVLVYSRMLYLEFMLSRAMGSFQRCMDRAMAFFGGVTAVDACRATFGATAHQNRNSAKTLERQSIASFPYGRTLAVPGCALHGTMRPKSLPNAPNAADRSGPRNPVRRRVGCEAMSGLLPRTALLVLVVSAGASSLTARIALAQSQGGLAIVVDAHSPELRRCFREEPLRHRIAQYSTVSLAETEALRLELYVDDANNADLRIYRGEELVARRRFAKLPIACADRRDAVALSIALALDGYIGERSSVPAPTAAQSRGSNGDPKGRSEPSAGQPTPPQMEPEANATPVQSDPEASGTPATVDPEASAKRANETATSGVAHVDAGPEASPAGGSRGSFSLIHLHLGGRWLAEALPSPVWTGALGVELASSSHFAIDASAMASTSATSTLAGAQAKSSLIGGELLGCLRHRLVSASGQACMGAVVAACRARGTGYPVRFPEATVLWVAGTARVALRWPDESALSLRLVAQGHVNAKRPQLRIDGSRERISAGPLGGSLGLDVLFTFE